VLSSDTIKLAKSRENIESGNFVSLSGTVSNDVIEYYNFIYPETKTVKLLEPQRLLRKLSDPVFDNQVHETPSGPTGIFVNGVELFNYKSNDSIYYGGLDKIEVLSPGSGYDIINPPSLLINDSFGSGAIGHCVINGSLERIDILDPGVDYLEPPIIEITGGNGINAKAEANLISYDYEISFSPINGDTIDLSGNTITFPINHKFREIEEVIYRNLSNSNVGGLVNNSKYFVSSLSEKKIKLYNSKTDAVVGINTVNLTSYGSGTHRLRSFNKKRRIGSIDIIDSGINYENRKAYVIGVSTASNTINIKNHNYEDGSLVVYNAVETPLAGLSSSSQYYLKKIDDNNFKLSEVGVGQTYSRYYYDRGEYVDITSYTSGGHYFNYPDIVATVTGKSGISTISGGPYDAVIQPIFRGEIVDVNLENSGTGYGSDDIINYNKSPEFILNSGSGAQVKPVIVNGQIVEVIVQSPGSNYISIPDLVINGDGSGAKLTPIISNGLLIGVVVNSPGINYTLSKTSIDIVNSGLNAKLRGIVKQWNINDFERAFNKSLIVDDDGFIQPGKSNDIGLQYSHIYAPRNLRKSVLTKKYINGIETRIKDLELFNGEETLSESHSPIIGWAYDGNPIYGPYGYSNPNGGVVTLMKSGYTFKTINELQLEGRPDFSLYPIGTFVNDYKFNGGGDLDEYNGRFAVTPEYPSGVYAYYCTVNPIDTDSSGPFRKYRRPVFPYVIGNQYKSKPIEYNFENNDSLDIDQRWIRNTDPYNLLKSNSGYSYLYEPNKAKQQLNSIVKTTSGTLSSIDVVDGGENYKVNDKLNITDSSALVSKVAGVAVSSIYSSEISLSDIEVFKSDNVSNYIGISSIAHNLTNLNTIKFSANSITEIIDDINVNTNQLILSNNIGNSAQTGIVTYFSVIGNLNSPTIIENDVYQIGSEKLKILNVDTTSSRIRVIREYDGTSSAVYTSGTPLNELTRKVYFNKFDIKNNSHNYRRNKQIYFNPVESLGIGTQYGPGITSTLYFANPGTGSTQIAIPTQSIYLPNHNLSDGDVITYSYGDGGPLTVSTNGISTSSLVENQSYYVTKMNNDAVGISTDIVSIGSTQLLYYIGIGSGVNHSFTLQNTNKLIGQIYNNDIFVNTVTDHNLSILDEIDINVKSGVSTTVVVSYNDYNRRIVINPKTISSVDVSENTLFIVNHNFKTGSKVIYTSTSEIGGLTSQSMYYVIVINNNKIKLASSKYNAINLVAINLTSSGDGVLGPINPPINVYRNNEVVFDLSDSTLSYTLNSQSLPAFEFKVFTNEDLTNEYLTSHNSLVFDVVKSGVVGIDTDAKLTLRINDDTPKNLYYSLVPVKMGNRIEKLEYYLDTDQEYNNTLSVLDSNYNGTYKISFVDEDIFKFSTIKFLEASQYTTGITYDTKSTTAIGGIKEVAITNKNKIYNKLPQILSVTSDNGKNALFQLNTDNIGSISQIELNDIGFNYNSDLTVRPEAKLPEIIKVDPLSTIDTIKILSQGINYLNSPDLLLFDGKTGELVNDIILDYNVGDPFVTIIRNTRGITNTIPSIIPINNTNGVGISSISYNASTKDVTVTLDAGFSDIDDYPFPVGTKVLVENVSVGATEKGYNSEAYDYSLFTIDSVDPNIGGIGGTFSYNIASLIGDNEFPGVYDTTFTKGTVTPSTYFPSFDVNLKYNDFVINETVVSSEISGIVERWDNVNSLLFVSTNSDFTVNSKIYGKTSGTVGLIENIISYETYYDVSSSTIVRKGWENEKGFLNNQFQRIHDSDYYQYFSYAVQSQISLDQWDDAVDSLNHTAGFKKFSNLIIESTPSSSFISTDQDSGSFESEVDYYSIVNLNCINDFDLANENSFYLGNNIKSNEIYLESQLIQDYFQSVGNRVLLIDDISDEFSSNPRGDKFSRIQVIDPTNVRYQKLFIHIFDTQFVNISQLSILSLLNDSNGSYLNSYGRVESNYDIGYFGYQNIDEITGNILFYPRNNLINNYSVSLLSFNIDTSSIGVSTHNLGTVGRIETFDTTLNSGTAIQTNIIGISSSYRSAKLIIQYSDESNSYYEVDELNLVHDGTDVYFNEYGQLNNEQSSNSIPGIGSYIAGISGSNITIDLVPNTPLPGDTNVNIIGFIVSDSSSTGIGTTTIGTNKIDTEYTSIVASGSPVATKIAGFDNTLKGGYFFVSIEDTTNNEYQSVELMSLYNENLNESFITEFSSVYSNSELGTFSTTVNSNIIEVLFTPNPNIDCSVSVFGVKIGLNDDIRYESEYNNLTISDSYGDYIGAVIDVKREFELYHNNLKIFERTFDASSTDVVDIINNTISIPNHYFTTGEEIEYDTVSPLNQPIGITSTNIPSVGITNELPSKLYVVKKSDLKIQVSASASEALLDIPIVLDLNTVGIGTNHRFLSKNQNKKCIISVDNVIQSPVTPKSTKTALVESLTLFSNSLKVVGISSIYSEDLIKVDDEIMRVTAVGVGTTNSIIVDRPWLGTTVGVHTSGAIVTKMGGEYNIIDNRINFINAPYGNTPLPEDIPLPDEVDFVGITTSSSFSGRVFMRNAETNTLFDPYTYNYLFDDISQYFNGINNNFTILEDNVNIAGISTSNAIVLINGIFQQPQRLVDLGIIGDYSLQENVGVTTIAFTGAASSTSYDVNTASVPRGGIIGQIGSTEGHGYQPIVSAGGTAVVSAAGTITSISIGNSGSGYRDGIQTIINVGVRTENLINGEFEIIGYANVNSGNITSVTITNPGSGYTNTNPPIVLFDEPVGYNNLPLIYTASSSGDGIGAVVDIVVGQGSSVTDFEIKNLGYGYNVGEVLTVAIGGSVGIPTSSNANFNEFQVTINSVISDKFNGFSIGDLQVLDPIDNLFDGIRRSFPIKLNGEQITIRSKPGSNIDVDPTLLIFINDTLQVPYNAYSIIGGSLIEFTEAPKGPLPGTDGTGDKTKILFYKGTGDIDVQFTDLLETIKIGDNVELNDSNILYDENNRTVSNVQSSNTILTNLYGGPGINSDISYSRALTWCMQTDDKIINGEYVGKSRVLYEPIINPFCNILTGIGTTSTEIFVDNIKTIFDSENENLSLPDAYRTIVVMSQDVIVAAEAEANVSIAGTVESITITNAGSGYFTEPEISISNSPLGVGTTLRATAGSTLTGNNVSTIDIISGGFGYTTTNAPTVLIEPPSLNYETIENVEYSGDFGVVVGYSTVSTGAATTGITFELFVPLDSYLRDININTVGVASTGISGIQTGYYFVIQNSNIGDGVTSLDQNGNIIGIGSTFVDNIYQAATVSIGQTFVTGVGVTNVTKVTVSLSDYNGLVGSGYSNYYGDFSWGRISNLIRRTPKQFDNYNNGLAGINTSPIVMRSLPLKYQNYNT
jgi:hypothetical protein